MKVKIAAVAVVIIAVAATIGASAYTTGSVSRDASVNVVNDDVGLIGLQDGTSGGLVTTTNGQLDIDFGNGGASGVNANATFTLGSTTDPTNHTAFNITNYDGASHDFTIQYTGAGATGDATTNIEYQVYDSTGTQVGTVSEESTSATLSGVASGETLYVVIVVDTNGLDSSNDLSGTLTVSA